MKKILVFDLPVRIFHWLLAALFLGAFAIATTVDDESTAFAVHAVLGAGAVFLVLLRLVWGVIGSRYARFGSLSLRPSALVRYLGGALTGRGPAAVGHNAATSWFMLAIFAVVLGLGLTGYRLGRGDESVEELHEVLAWTGIVLAALHVAGILWHLARRRENLVAGMVTGRKTVASEEPAIRSARPASAVALLALVAAFGALLYSGFDAQARQLRLPLLAAPLTIGEAEENGEGGETGGEQPGEGGEEGEEEDGDDDDHATRQGGAAVVGGGPKPALARARAGGLDTDDEADGDDDLEDDDEDEEDEDDDEVEDDDDED